MDTDKKLQASAVVAAPADAVFALLSDPYRHAEIDGAESIRAPGTYAVTELTMR
jgi:tRNA A37 threonylcarbamoyladenosine synthetase subunit TsaC/SUA5/YrdC